MVTLVPEISALSSIFDVRGGGGKDRRSPTSQGRKGSAGFRHAVRWERNCEYLARRRSGAGGRSSARGPEASLRHSAHLWLDRDRKSTRLNSSHVRISYAVFCLKKKKKHYRRIV